MSDYYISPKEAFDATADAIRAKTGSQANIEWTVDGFADAIEDIPSGGGGGGDEVIQTTVINSSIGNLTFDSILQALEDMDYTLSYKDCVLFFRASGSNASSAPPTNYAYNNWQLIVKDWVIWDVNYNRCQYGSVQNVPDSFNPFWTNNALQNSANVIQNHKIVNTYASPFEAAGGVGTTVTMFEVPFDWTDYFST